MQVERRSFAAARDALSGRRCVLVGGTAGNVEREDAEVGGAEGGGGDCGQVFVAAEAVALHCRGDLAPALYRLPDELQPWQILFSRLGKHFECGYSIYR